MFKFASTLLLATIAVAPAIAAPAAGRPLDFERDGIHYVGTVVDEANGRRVISGREVGTGRDFKLVVFNGRVNGRYDGQSVSYLAAADAPVATLAAASPSRGR